MSENLRMPAVRARSARDSILYVEKTRPEAFEKMREHMSDEAWETIMTAARTEWIPTSVDRETVEAFVGVFGEAGATEVWREFLGPHSKSPMLRGIMSMSFRLLGVSPGSIVKFAPRALGQAYRDFFEVGVPVVGEGHASLVLESVAPQVLECRPYLVCLRAVFLGFFDLAQTQGELDFDVDHDARRIVATWTW